MKKLPFLLSCQLEGSSSSLVFSCWVLKVERCVENPGDFLLSVTRLRGMKQSGAFHSARSFPIGRMKGLYWGPGHLSGFTVSWCKEIAPHAIDTKLYLSSLVIHAALIKAYHILITRCNQRNYSHMHIRHGSVWDFDGMITFGKNTMFSQYRSVIHSSIMCNCKMNRLKQVKNVHIVLSLNKICTSNSI